MRTDRQTDTGMENGPSRAAAKPHRAEWDGGTQLRDADRQDETWSSLGSMERLLLTQQDLNWVSESPNPSMVGVGRALCGSPSPTPCPSRVTHSRLHSTVSRWVLKTAAACHPILFPGQPCRDSAREVPGSTHSLSLLLMSVLLESPAAPTPFRAWVLFAPNISRVAASARDSFALSVPRLWSFS